MQQALHILILYDLPEYRSDPDCPEYICDNEDRPTERDVAKAIQKLGMKLSTYGVYNDIKSTIDYIEKIQPDVIFNLCETFQGGRHYEGHVASLIELLNYNYTGCRAEHLNLCKDKALTKKILSFEGIPIPKFQVVTQNQGFQDFAFYPAIVKPLNLEGSEGIAQASVVYDSTACKDRVQFLHEHLKADVIVEEFIHGREIYVGVLQIQERIVALPIRELFMKNLKQDQALIATFQAKWNDHYRERWGVSTSKAGPMPEDRYQHIQKMSIGIFQSLGLSGYARVDWRINSEGLPVFLEINPNPGLAADDDFALAAKSYGISYNQLIYTLIRSALKKNPLSSDEHHSLSNIQISPTLRQAAL